MINFHSTAQCPSCNKDSWKSEYSAFMSVVQCPWCQAHFTWDKESNSYKVVDKKGK